MQRVRALEGIALHPNALRSTHEIVSAEYEDTGKGSRLVATFKPVGKPNEPLKDLEARVQGGALLSIAEFGSAMPLRVEQDGKSLKVSLGGELGWAPNELAQAAVRNIVEQSKTWHAIIREPEMAKRQELADRGKALSAELGRLYSRLQAGETK